MKNADMPVTPIMDAGTGTVSNAGHAWAHNDKDECIGLTKREYFAGLAMQGLIASFGQHDVNDVDEVASDAVLFADALLAKLDKGPDA